MILYVYMYMYVYNMHCVLQVVYYMSTEYFGSEPIVVEEEKEKEGETPRRPSMTRVRRSESQRSATGTTSSTTSASTPSDTLR